MPHLLMSNDQPETAAAPQIQPQIPAPQIQTPQFCRSVASATRGSTASGPARSAERTRIWSRCAGRRPRSLMRFWLAPTRKKLTCGRNSSGTSPTTRASRKRRSWNICGQWPTSRNPPSRRTCRYWPAGALRPTTAGQDLPRRPGFPTAVATDPAGTRQCRCRY